MTTSILELDDDTFVSLIASSDGDVNLIAERFDTLMQQPYGTTKDYAVSTRIGKLDIQAADTLSSKLRTLMVIKLYNLVNAVGNQLSMSLGELQPAELAKTYTSLVSSFGTLTQQSVKVSFDYEAELRKLSEEFNKPLEEIKSDFGEIEKRLKAVK